MWDFMVILTYFFDMGSKPSLADYLHFQPKLSSGSEEVEYMFHDELNDTHKAVDDVIILADLNPLNAVKAIPNLKYIDPVCREVDVERTECMFIAQGDGKVGGRMK